jgi:cytochrome c-type biogenesis protein CcmH/NrfG
VLTRAVALEPASLNARFNLARALIAQGRLQDALAQLEAAHRLAPDDADTRRELESLRKQLGSN